MSENQHTVINNVTFNDTNVHGGDELRLNDYRFNKSILIENYHFQNNLIILTTKKHFHFKNCQIDGHLYLPDNVSKISFEDCTIASVNGNIRVAGGVIKKLAIKNLTITNKFYLNTDSPEKKLTIKELQIENVTFQEKLKLYHCTIEQWKAKDIDFQKDIHISLCSISSDTIEFNGINFKGSCYFTDTQFDNFIRFEKVTFFENVDFQKTRFKKGLDISQTTIKKGINFAGCEGLDSEESIKNTTIETYRIIKNHFLKLQNKIEANKFYSLELKKKETLLTRKDWQDKIIYTAHKLSSNFGRSWVRGLIGIFITGLLTFLFIDGNILWYLPDCPTEILSYGLEEVVKYSYLLNKSKDFFENHPFVFVLNKITLGYLYYQFIQAVRKDTRK